MKQHPREVHTQSVELLAQETIKHIDGRPLSGVADELLPRHIDQPSIAKQNISY
jgi:hypothetical protein